MKVLLTIDGSDCSRSALAFLRTFPWAAPPDLLALTAWSSIPPGILERLWGVDDGSEKRGELEAGLQQRAERVLEEARKSLEGLACTFEGVALEGQAGDRILQVAAESKSDLIVIGKRGLNRVQEFLLGSVSRRVLRNAARSILVARPKPQPVPVKPESSFRILFASDGSSYSKVACEMLKKMVSKENTEVKIIRVVAHHELIWAESESLKLLQKLIAEENRQAQEDLRDLVERMKSDSWQATWSVYEGDPAAEIVDAARKRDAHLIVLGHKGATNHPEIKLGSVAERVAQMAPCSVLVVRPEGAEQQEDFESAS